MSATQLEQHLTVREAAQLLAVHPNSIRRRIGTRELGSVKLGSGRGAPVRIPAEELERYLDEHRAERRA